MMGNLKMVITTLLVAGLAVGCTAKHESSTNELKQGGSVTAKRDKAVAESKQAARAIQAYGYAKKAEFVNQMKGELAQAEDDLEQLAAMIEKTSGAVKAEAKVTLVAVREKWSRVNKQLDQAESATESTWDEVAGGFQDSYGEMKDSFNETRKWLSAKIEP